LNLGVLLRSHRKQRGLTLKAVAERAGISEGFLSQVENNVKTPSLESLMAICRALGVDAGELMSRLQNQARLFVIRRDEWDEVDLPHTGFATRRFCPPEAREAVDSAVLFIAPGRSIPVRKGVKNGQEILCVLQGTLELVHGDEVVTLRRGDAVHLWTEPSRQAVTNRGRGLAVVLWVGTL
jgi:transcriptional regulator with XRE-family HTH domain